MEGRSSRLVHWSKMHKWDAKVMQMGFPPTLNLAYMAYFHLVKQASIGYLININWIGKGNEFMAG